MPKFIKSGGVAVALCLSSTTMVQADVTAKQVWDNWRSIFESYSGLKISNIESMSGDTLTISDYSVSMESEGNRFEMKIPQILFKETGNGTVSVTMSDEYPVHIAANPETGKTMEMTLIVRQPGLTLVARGDEADTTYDFAAPHTTITIDKMVVDGAPVDMALDLAFDGMAGFYNVKGTDTKSVTSAFNADALNVTGSLTNPDGDGGTMTVKGRVAEIRSSSDSSLGSMFDSQNMAESLKAGFRASGAFSHGAVTYDISTTSAGSDSTSSGSAASGALDFSMDEDHLNYGGSANGVDMTFSGTDIPFPAINIAMAESAFNFFMPITQSDTPKDFGLLVKLAGLRVSDDLWNIFDPTSILPRDPATLVMDFAGTANWKIDIMDPEAASAMTAVPPGEVQALSMKTLQLSFAGADLTGKGDFTFDNSDLVTFDGIPKPTGAIDLKLVGGNGLIDKLVSMGVIPEDQAMGARMMMGLFARPVEGADDTLTSKIEVKDDGSVVANGQRLR